MATLWVSSAPRLHSLTCKVPTTAPETTVLTVSRPCRITWQQRDNPHPWKVDWFFPPLAPRLRLNSGYRHHSQPANHNIEISAATIPRNREPTIYYPGESSGSGSFTLSSCSLAKSRPCMEVDRDPAWLNNMEAGTPQADFHSPLESPDPIASFPTTGQIVSDFTLKDMLMSLCLPTKF